MNLLADPVVGSAPHNAVTVPDLTEVERFSDAALLSAGRQIAAARRRLDALAVQVTTEFARRSDRSLGQSGLAARLGVASVEDAVQQVTGATRAEAKALTTVAGATSERAPWLGSVARSVAEGELSVAAAAAIASGLGAPSAEVSLEELCEAAGELVAAAPESTPEAIAKDARRVRERLDAERIADLESHRRSRRSLTWFRRPDGMTALSGLLDPESAAVITSAIDTVLSPRRGGPRFVDDGDAAQAAAIAADPRTAEQLALDTLVDIVDLAVRAAGSDIDPQRLFGTRTPAVRVHVTVETLIAGAGIARIEGQDAAVSAQTAARHVCTSGILPVLFDGASAIDAGRVHRLHSPRQRVALAAQWGGCAWHDCTRPPAMTEVHHVTAWDGRNTTLANGIPLCRFHHLQLHNTGWRIEVRGPFARREHWLIPPPGHPVALRRTRLIPRYSG